MDGQSLQSYLYDFEIGYISPASSLTFLPKQGHEEGFVFVSTADYLFKFIFCCCRAIDNTLHILLDSIFPYNTKVSLSICMSSSAMTQTNSATRVQRNVRRRPKFNSVFSGNGSVSIAQSIASPPPSAGYTWEFMGEEGVWIEYQTPSCSLGSAEIERRYQKNPKGQIRFKAGRYSYTLDFSGMCQTNVRIGTKRTVRRTQCEAQQTSSGGLGLRSRWQFQDVDGTWKDFTTRSDTCSVSSQDIEAQYQQNPNGTMNFTTRRFSYQLDFSGKYVIFSEQVPIEGGIHGTCSEKGEFKLQLGTCQTHSLEGLIKT
uniref:Uncharacterized LOC109878555 n=1 Tax=Oncorhynchus kisutch TaxID=8019 RepID=A0A8C7JEY9_ONCKI